MNATRISRRTALGLALPALLAPAWSHAATGPHKRSAQALIAAARAQIGVTLSYDPGYTNIAFPGGDVPRSKGVCTDVLIRAYRDAFGLDLQALVNADMRAAFREYPRIWGLSRPDANIDHRRVPNLRTYMLRQKALLPIPASSDGWQPGDIFTCMINGRLPHIGIVSNRKTANGRWAVIHNIGQGTREEDALMEHPINGRYRLFLTAPDA